jgi:TonB family protein
MNRLLVCALSVCLLVPMLGIAQEGVAFSVRSAVAPVYPPTALIANTSGDVRVAVTVTEIGNVIKADLVSGNPLLSNAAVEAAKQWKFEVSDQAKLQLTFSFRMMPKDTLVEAMTPVFSPPFKIEVRGKLP